MDFPEFQANLRNLMDSRGLSGNALAAELGIPDATINRYLHGGRVPKLNNIIALAKYFGVSVDWLLGLTDNKYETWAPETLEIAHLYSIAPPHERSIVEAVLKPFKED